jgi:protein gp37
MANNSKIEWTEATWNPTTGCTKVSTGCKFCYAEVMARRLKAMGQPKYANGFNLTLHEELLEQPLRWKKPRRIFVNSMSDLFHMDVPDEYIGRVFDAMNNANWHTYQVLTKRAERLADLSRRFPSGPHIWMGVSVESAGHTWRIEHLRQTHAHTRFLSLEPLLGPLNDLNLTDIDWVIVGGESGPKARPMDPDWARSIRDQCVSAQVPFFFKQWGGINKKRNGRVLDGRTWDEMPQPMHCADKWPMEHAKSLV